MHCRDRLIRARRPLQPFHGKKRVPVPVQPVNRTRSPKDGLPRVLEWSARRTARALAESAQQGKDGLQPFR